MTNEQYIKHIISESMAIKAENKKLKAKIENQEHTINILNNTLQTMRSHIDILKEKYSK